MNIRKTLLALGTGVLLSLTGIMNVFALNTKISFSDPSVSVGSEVNVVMKVSSVDGANLGDSVIELKYDTNLLDFVSGTNAQETSNGLIKVSGKAGESDLEYVYNIKFNSLKAGETGIIVENWGIHDTSGNMATLEHRGSSKVTIAEAGGEGTTPTAAEIAQTLAPGETTQAEVASVETLAQEPGSSISGEIADGESSDSGIVIDKQSYELAADFDASLLPVGFEKQEYDYKGQMVAAGVQADNSAKLMYLLTQDGSGNLFFYDESHDTWSSFVNFTVASKAITVVPVTADVIVPFGFTETKLDLNGNIVSGYIWEQDTEHNYVIIYGMNAEGIRNFYRYDFKDKTIQRFFEDPNMRGNTSDYADAFTYYKNYQKAYEERGTKLYIVTGIAAALLLLIIGFLLKIFVLDRKEEQERQERKKLRQKEVELDKEAARKEIESLTANLPKEKEKEKNYGDAKNPEDVKKHGNVNNNGDLNNIGDTKNRGDVKKQVDAKPTSSSQNRMKSRKKGNCVEPVKLDSIEDLDAFDALNQSSVNFVVNANEMDALYPDTTEEEDADQISTIISEVEEEQSTSHAMPDSFLFDKNVALTVTFLDDSDATNQNAQGSNAKKADAKSNGQTNKGNIANRNAESEMNSNQETSVAANKKANSEKPVDAHRSQNSDRSVDKKKMPDSPKAKNHGHSAKVKKDRDFEKFDSSSNAPSRENEDLPSLSNLVNMEFQNEYYEESEDYSETRIDEISDRLNKNLGIDENVLTLESLEENLIKEYDNQVIETALDESAKHSVENFVVPIDETDFKKAVISEEKQNQFSKYDTQEIDR